MKLSMLIPGNNFSGLFLDSMIAFIGYCISSNIELSIKRTAGSLVPHVREDLLGNQIQGQDPQNPIYSKPLNGADYDYLLLVDSDTIFTPEHFQRLLRADKDFISGIARMANLKYSAVIMDNEYKLNDWITLEKLKEYKDNNKLLEAYHTGLPFCLIKKGVLESIKLPWFTGPTTILGGKEVYSGEDVYFTNKIRLSGVTLFVDPNVVTGHLKEQLLL